MRILTAHPGLFKDDQLVESHISFVPFVRFMKEKAQTADGARAAYYTELVRHFESNPELQQPLKEDVDIAQYQDYLDLLTAAVFPVTMDDSQDIYGIGVPHRFAIFYYSDKFRKIFSDSEAGLMAMPKGVSEDKIKKNKLAWLYKLILERWYGMHVHYDSDMEQSIEHPETGMRKYVKVNIDARFVDVKLKGTLPKFDCDNVCTGNFQEQNFEQLVDMLPLDNFALEGFVIWTIKDVTEEHVVTGMKNLVLNIRNHNELQTYAKAREYLRTMSGRPDLNIHLTPFLKVNDRYVMETAYTSHSIIFSNARNDAERNGLNEQLLEYFQSNESPLVIEHVTRESVAMYPFLRYLPLHGVTSFMLMAIRHENNVLGMLEIATTGGDPLGWDLMVVLNPAYSVGSLLLRRSIELHKERISSVIKDQFTALQPAVEWKFQEAAWEFLHTPKAKQKDIGNILFQDVYPLYGAVDIRNSSIERGSAIRDDLKEQLALIQHTFKKMNGGVHLPLLEELQFKTDRMLKNLQQTLFAEDEVRINEFLDYEIAPTFKHLYDSEPELKPALNDYFRQIDATSGHVYHHRQEYEESLQQINSAINAYLEKEKEGLQQSFPCYFEKYRTDGVEYNIYIGQSIAPDRKFDNLYLRNLRLWQLSSMANIARITHQLEPHLNIPLQTTQLILAHSNTIDISFRKDEKRFDVEGAYNIRYEIMKKRIDKVRIRDTNERLTQPGKIAIVYSYVREAEEYSKYIEFLQNKGIILSEVEMLDLEEVQGISGLKAIRLSVNLDGHMQAPVI